MSETYVQTSGEPATAHHMAFYVELMDLMRKYGVHFEAEDDDKPYGQHCGLISVEFDSPNYGCFETTSIYPPQEEPNESDADSDAE